MIPTLRLLGHYIAPMNGQIAVKLTSLPLGGGPDGRSQVLVPEGTKVGYKVFVLHRRKDIYGDDANIFRPERWLDGDRFLGGSFGWNFVPFNQGPRACLGRKLVLSH